MLKALVTGSRGFVGRHLVALLENEGVEVIHFNLRNGQDILNYELLRNTLDAERPDYIFHLAAQAFVPESFTNPQRAIQTNTIGSLNLLEAVRQLHIKTKILLAGTSEEYGDSHTNREITEETTLNPKSPYAVSKVAMEYLGKIYAEDYGMEVVTTRSFNHSGYGRGEMYAESAFAKQIVECELGKRQIVKHGNLASIRNYMDVRDVIRAYRLAIDLPPSVYNVCSDNSVTMKEVMDLLISNSTKDISTELDIALYRPGDFSFNKPSCEKFKKLTGWSTTYSLEDTLVSVLNYWRDK